MVFRKGNKPPKSIHWRDAIRAIELLGGVFVRQKGDHKHYKRSTKKGTYLITIPVYDNIEGDLLRSIIRQSGVKKKYFWMAYNGEVPTIIKTELKIQS